MDQLGASGRAARARNMEARRAQIAERFRPGVRTLVVAVEMGISVRTAIEDFRALGWPVPRPGSAPVEVVGPLPQERLREIRRKRAKLAADPMRNTRATAKWNAANPEKRRAHKIVEFALRRREILRQCCERCGQSEGVHAHHDDYSKPLEIMWLCPAHHRDRHRELACEAGGAASNQAVAA